MKKAMNAGLILQEKTKDNKTSSGMSFVDENYHDDDQVIQIK
jgi:hypothetical protein